jgi:hypothetical protein
VQSGIDELHGLVNDLFHRKWYSESKVGTVDGRADGVLGHLYHGVELSCDDFQLLSLGLNENIEELGLIIFSQVVHEGIKLELEITMNTEWILDFEGFGECFVSFVLVKRFQYTLDVG